MTRIAIAILVLFLLLAPSPLWCADDNPSPVPMIRTIEPAKAKTGEVVLAEGENLSALRVTSLFLTKGEKDIKVEVVSQSNT